MGEYATHKGEHVKIGTCENMYYLRAEQCAEIDGYEFDAETLGVLRFRFPFPDEDGTEPGHFDDYGRGVRVPGYSLPETLSGDEHHSVQFTSSAGYVLSIPCPEQYGQAGLSVETPDGLRIGRNGFNGYPVVSQQAHRGGVLVTLLRCGACGGIHRLDTSEDAEPVIEAFRAEAEREEWRRLSSDWDEEAGGWGGSCNYGNEPAHGEQYRAFLHAMADRIAAGYAVAVTA